MSEPVAFLKRRPRQYDPLPTSTRLQTWARRAYAGRNIANERGQTKFPQGSLQISEQLCELLNLKNQHVWFDDNRGLWGKDQKGDSILLTTVLQK